MWQVVVTTVTLVAFLASSACGETADPVSSPSTGKMSSSAAGPAPSPRTSSHLISVTVVKGEVRTPSRRVKVRQGTPVAIAVTSDEADELHLHGYDLSLKLTPGHRAVLRFTADAPGVFEVELHGSGTRLFELQVG